MPVRPLNNCLFAGCARLAKGDYCDEHRKKRPAAIRKRSQRSAFNSMYGRKWKKRRANFLRKNPLCAHHLDKGIVKEAQEVDHIEAHKGDEQLFWDKTNWQSLCKSCHSTKTVQEDGGFGRAPTGRAGKKCSTLSADTDRKSVV